MSPLFSEDYIRRLVRGDPPTESHFSAYFNNLLFMKLRGRTRSPEMLEEVRQETLLRVLQAVRAGELDHPDRLGAFVSAVCNNVLHEFLHEEYRYDRDGKEPPEPLDHRIALDREVIDNERKRQVEGILAELPPKDRAVLRMLFLEEREKPEICRVLKVSPEYLRVVLYRAKMRFRELYLGSDRKNGGPVKRF